MGSNLVSINIEQPSLPQIGFAQAAGMIVIKDQPSYDFAAEQLQQVKAQYARIEGERVKLKKPIDDAAKAVQALFKPILSDLEAAERAIKGTMGDYLVEQQRIADKRQREADEAAAKERAELEAKARAAMASGDVETAAAIAEVAEIVQAPVISTAVQQAAGISSRKVWKVEVLDKTAFLQCALGFPAAVAPNPALLGAVEIDTGVLAKLAALTDGAPIPGCRVWQETVIASRRAA